MKNKNNIRDAECCFNCAFGIYDSQGAVWCNIDKDFPNTRWTKEKMEWVSKHIVSEHSVCDEFEMVY